MAELKFNFLLVGKTGQGMSATGNTILNRRAFKTSVNSTSETKYVNFSFSQFEKYTFMVVDWPGLQDTDLDKFEDKIKAARCMDTALAMCYGGVDAFLLVIKFGVRLTQEDKDALETLKKIFGDTFMDHVIVVVTHGDLFQLYVGETDQGVSFTDWCQRQYGELKQLYSDCNGRFVLFNNKATNDEIKRVQITQLAQMTHEMINSSGRYTSACFKTVQLEREKWLLKLQAPQFRAEVEERLSLLASEMDSLFKHPSSDDTAKIRSQVNQLNDAIMQHDKGCGVLQDLIDLVKAIEKKLECAEKFDSLSKELEDYRKAKSPFEVAAESMSFGAVGLIAHLVTGSNYRPLSLKERKILEQRDEIKAKWKKLNE